MDPLATVMPWAAGFALAMEFFPQLMRQDPQQVMEPLAAIYRAFDPDDLEDADELLAAIEELEPPADLEEAVEALVSSTLLLADVTRPQSGQPRTAGARRAARGQAQGQGPGPSGTPRPGQRPAQAGPQALSRPRNGRGSGEHPLGVQAQPLGHGRQAVAAHRACVGIGAAMRWASGARPVEPPVR
jgi:uncharacterized protein